MVARKKPEEQQELVTEETVDMPASPYEQHASMMLERSKAAHHALMKLDKDMVNKALTLLEASGDGCGELRIKQIEKAIEIYKTLQSL